MIISGGNNVYPREVEEVIVKHPEVAQVVVVGIPDDYWGEAVHAVVVPGGRRRAHAEELIDYCGEVPRRLQETEGRRLRRRAAGQRLRQGPAPRGPRPLLGRDRAIAGGEPRRMSRDQGNSNWRRCCERVGPGVGLLTLNRPDRGNGVVVEMVRDLFRVLDEWEPDLGRACRGRDRAPAASSRPGADLVAMRDYVRDEVPKTLEPFNARVLFPLTQRLLASRLVFVAAVNGGATAGGLDFALACDMRIASTAAKLGETYINMGLAPGNGGTWLLPKLVGSGVAAELALTGDVVDAARALEIGLVSRVVEPEELVPAAIESGRPHCGKPWRAVEATKQALRASWTVDFASAMNTSYHVTAELHHQGDLREAIDAFLEKRPPVFNADVDR